MCHHYCAAPLDSKHGMVCVPLSFSSDRQHVPPSLSLDSCVSLTESLEQGFGSLSGRSCRKVPKVSIEPSHEDTELTSSEELQLLRGILRLDANTRWTRFSR